MNRYAHTLPTHVHHHRGQPLSVVLLADVAARTPYDLATTAEAARRMGFTVYSVPRTSTNRGVAGCEPAIVAAFALRMVRAAHATAPHEHHQGLHTRP